LEKEVRKMGKGRRGGRKGGWGKWKTVLSKQDMADIVGLDEGGKTNGKKRRR